MVSWLRSSALVSLAAGMLAWLPAAEAFAYCRETIDTQSVGPCIENPGSPRLTWKQSCMTYVFNDKFWARMTGMTESKIRQTFEDSFQTWADVDCSGRAPFFAEQLSGTTPTANAEYLRGGGNESVILARTRSEWKTLQHDDSALALTLLWHNSKTGQILDVDMEYNTGAGIFEDCVAASCGRDEMDLQNTVTHEAGHLLGLGHSAVQGSTMENDALDGETSKRDLEPDDKRGYCALALPEFTCSTAACECDAPEAPTPTTTTTRTTTCSVAAPGGHQHAFGSAWLALLGLGLWRGARRRRGVTLR